MLNSNLTAEEKLDIINNMHNFNFATRSFVHGKIAEWMKDIHKELIYRIPEGSPILNEIPEMYRKCNVPEDKNPKEISGKYCEYMSYINTRFSDKKIADICKHILLMPATSREELREIMQYIFINWIYAIKPMTNEQTKEKYSDVVEFILFDLLKNKFYGYGCFRMHFSKTGIEDQDMWKQVCFNPYMTLVMISDLMLTSLYNPNDVAVLIYLLMKDLKLDPVDNSLIFEYYASATNEGKGILILNRIKDLTANPGDLMDIIHSLNASTDYIKYQEMNVINSTMRVTASEDKSITSVEVNDSIIFGDNILPEGVSYNKFLYELNELESELKLKNPIYDLSEDDLAAVSYETKEKKCVVRSKDKPSKAIFSIGDEPYVLFKVPQDSKIFGLEICRPSLQEKRKVVSFEKGPAHYKLEFGGVKE